MVILYPQESGAVAVTYAPEGEDVRSAARRITPHGTPFLIVQESTLPDSVFIDAWTANFSKPDGVGIGAPRWFIEQAENEISQGINVDENRALIERMKLEIFQIEGVRL